MLIVKRCANCFYCAERGAVLSLPYDKKNVKPAQNLRRRATKWEKRLWYDFLSGYPVRFQRQKPIGAYIADFYCHEARLVVELDGKYHQDSDVALRDPARQADLEEAGLLVLRFTNRQIERDFSRVCEAIHLTVEERSGQQTELQQRIVD